MSDPNISPYKKELLESERDNSESPVKGIMHRSKSFDILTQDNQNHNLKKSQ